MNLRRAIDIVLNEAEVSALGNRDDTQLDVLKSIELLNDFFSWVADDVKIWDEMTKDGYEIHDFLDDHKKMKDFEELSKEQFLKEHPFIKETEYNLTRSEQKRQQGI